MYFSYYKINRNNIFYLTQVHLSNKGTGKTYKAMTVTQWFISHYFINYEYNGNIPHLITRDSYWLCEILDIVIDLIAKKLCKATNIFTPSIYRYLHMISRSETPSSG